MFKNYLTIALRTLRNQKGYAAINVVGLAVGIACCLLIALFVRSELLYDRHHDNAGEIYRVALDGRTQSGPIQTAMSAPAWGPMLAAEMPEVAAAVRFKPPNQRWLVRYEDRAFWEKGFVFAEANVFDVFTFPLVAGEAATALVAPFSVVLTETTARKYFGDEDPLGQLLRLDNNFDFTVTGVMADVPETAHMPVTFLAALSSLEAVSIYGDDFLKEPIGPALYTYVRLVPGARVDALEARLPDFVTRHIGPQLTGMGIEMTPFLQPLADIHLHSRLENEIAPNGDAATVYGFAAIALFILLLACINFMNLATARSASRAREVGLRKVMGADRAQLIRQFLGESVLMAAAATVAAVGLVALALPFFNGLTGKAFAFGEVFGGGFVLALVGIALVVGVVAGSYPAFFLSGFRPVAVLNGTPRTGGAWLREGLVVFQFAVSIFLIAGTVVVYNQLQFMRGQSLGFDKEHVVVLQFSDPQIRRQYQTFRDRIALLPTVTHVSAASSAPGSLIQNALFLPEGAAADQTLLASVFVIDYGFEETLGLEVVAGRPFSRDHGTDAHDTFLLTETAVASFGFASPQAALGQTLLVTGTPRRGAVVGVVRDFHSKSLRQQIEPTLLTIGDEQTYQYLLARTRPGEATATVAALERVWREVFPEYVFEYSFLDEDFDRLFAAEAQIGNLFGGFAALALLIACLGLFGLASFTAERRTKEIGVRKVLGASVWSIIVLLSHTFGRYVLVAFVVGAPLAYLVMNRWLDGFAYRADLGVLPFLLVGLGALTIAWLTVAYQSIRAATVNPVESLRAA